MFLKRVFLFTMLILLLVACDASINENANDSGDEGSTANENEEEIEMTFFGESDNWEAEVNAVFKNGKEEREFKLSYTGDDPDAIDTINYDLEGPDESVSVDDDSLNIENYVTDNEKYNEAMYTEDEDAEYEVTVDWNDESESLDLENE